MAEETNAAQAVTAPDPEDFTAWYAAEQAGQGAGETVTAAEGGEKSPEITSEPAGEKPGEVEAKPEPEAGEKKEPEPEKKAELEREQGESLPGWARRLDKQRKREIRELREQTDALRAELAARKIAEPAAAQPVQEPSVTATAEPQETDFDTHAEYIKALAKHTTAAGIADFQASVKRQLDAEDAAIRNREAAAVQVELDAKWVKDVERGREKHPDFDELVLEGELPERGPVFERAIWESEYTDEVMYYLAKNPNEILRIRVLQPHQIGRELGKIETQFSGKTKAPETKPIVNSTPKPKPPTPIGGGSSISARDDPNDPRVAEDFGRWRRAEGVPWK